MVVVRSEITHVTTPRNRGELFSLYTLIMHQLVSPTITKHVIVVSICLKCGATGTGKDAWTLQHRHTAAHQNSFVPILLLAARRDETRISHEQT